MPNKRRLFCLLALLKKISVGHLCLINSLPAIFFAAPAGKIPQRSRHANCLRSSSLVACGLAHGNRKTSLRVLSGSILFLFATVNFADEFKSADESTVEKAVEQTTAEQPETINTEQSTSKQQPINLNPQKQLTETKNPGVEFDPSEDISEDTSVPFPVDI